MSNLRRELGLSLVKKDKDPVSTSDVAWILDCRPETVRRMKRAGRIRVVCLGPSGRHMYDRSEIDRLAAERNRKPDC